MWSNQLAGTGRRGHEPLQLVIAEHAQHGVEVAVVEFGRQIVKKMIGSLAGTTDNK